MREVPWEWILNYKMQPGYSLDDRSLRLLAIQLFYCQSALHFRNIYLDFSRKYHGGIRCPVNKHRLANLSFCQKIGFFTG